MNALFLLLAKHIKASYFIIFLSVFIFNRCKEKGCTDPPALNYNNTAGEDDGTCVYCKTEHLFVDSMVIYLVDNHSWSPYYSQTVAEVCLIQYNHKNNDEKCGEGKCTISTKIKGLVSKNMQFDFLVQGFISGTPAYTNNVIPIIIPKDQVLQINGDMLMDKFFQCARISSGNANAIANSGIYYY